MKTILGTMTFSDQVNRDDSRAIIEAFRASGHAELDTAYVYNEGKTEELLGSLRQDGSLTDSRLATKVNPWAEGGLTPAAVDHQFTTSLHRLGAESVDLLYLHAPDLNTPISETLAAIHRHYEAGRFERFGLSNYAAWQVAEIVELCRHRGWPQPVVYQGMYNALTRDVERELLQCLQHYEMAFYAYNPLAGGLLTGKHRHVEDSPADGRFARVAMYRDRYWKPDYFQALEPFSRVTERLGIAPAEAAIRWLVHHSALAGGQQHGIILGASSMRHFEQNLAACEAGPLPAELVATLDDGWETVRPACIKYFRP